MKETCSFYEIIRERDERILALNDSSGLGDIKKLLDSFGESIEILSEAKETQYNNMLKALNILKN